MTEIGLRFCGDPMGPYNWSREGRRRALAYYDAITTHGHEFEAVSAVFTGEAMKAFWTPVVDRIVKLLGALGRRRG